MATAAAEAAAGASARKIIEHRRQQHRCGDDTSNSVSHCPAPGDAPPAAGAAAGAALSGAAGLSVSAMRFIVTGSAVGSGAPSTSLAMVCTEIVPPSICVIT